MSDPQLKFTSESQQKTPFRNVEQSKNILELNPKSQKPVSSQAYHVKNFNAGGAFYYYRSGNFFWVTGNQPTNQRSSAVADRPRDCVCSLASTVQYIISLLLLLTMHTNTFCSVLFGVHADDWYDVEACCYQRLRPYNLFTTI